MNPGTKPALTAGMTVEPIRKILPYTSIAVLIALLYVGYTFYTRKQETRQVDQQVAEKKAEQDRDSVARMGGTALKINSFYAAPPSIAKGQAAKLCYGVANAKSLQLAPAVEQVWPSLSRCFDVSPAKTTHYTLTALDEKGHSAQQSIDVTVQ